MATPANSTGANPTGGSSDPAVLVQSVPAKRRCDGCRTTLEKGVSKIVISPVKYIGGKTVGAVQTTASVAKSVVVGSFHGVQRFCAATRSYAGSAATGCCNGSKNLCDRVTSCCKKKAESGSNSVSSNVSGGASTGFAEEVKTGAQEVKVEATSRKTSVCCNPYFNIALGVGLGAAAIIARKYWNI